MMLAREPLLLEAWFLAKQREPDSDFNAHLQTWAWWDVRRLVVVLNAMRRMAERDKAHPLTEFETFGEVSAKLR